MKLFKKGKDKNSLWRDQAACRIACFLIRIQSGFALIMNKQFSGLPTKKIKVFLVLFCFGSGGWSLYYMGSAFFGNHKKSILKTDHVQIPEHYDRSGEEAVHQGNLIDEFTWRDLHAFKNYIDSLKANRPKQYDSINRERPGLVDSLAALEEIYYSQKIK